MNAWRRRRLHLALLGALLALGVSAVAAQAAAPRIMLGRFAGYISTPTRVTSVSATFAVPRIRPGSPAGSLAGTWIGAQAAGSKLKTVPFIQIGVNEARLPRGVLPRLHARNIYYAFWSDTRLHFHPQPLFPVRPGDYVAASLRRLHHGWKLAIVDANNRFSRRFETTDEGRGTFDLAEWFQEDVTNTKTGAEYPYPKLAGGLFRQLRVDSITPGLARLRSQWMSNTRDDIAPSAISGNSFTLSPATLGRAARRYLRIAQTFDAAERVYFAKAAGWTAQTPTSQIAAASARFALAVRANIASFADDHWRPRLEPRVRLLISQTRSLLRVVHSAAAAARAGPTAWRARLYRANTDIYNAALPILRHLHAPQV